MPSKRTAAFLAFLTLVAILLGLNYFYQPFINQGSTSEVATTPQGTPTSESVPSLDLSSFTPRQKVTWLLAAPVTLVEGQPVSATTSAWLTTNHPGALTLFGSRLSAESVTNQIAELKSASGSVEPQPLIAVDHEGGQVQRLSGKGFTVLPSWQNLCNQSATSSARLVRSSALELRQAGIDLVFAPMTDVAVNHPVLRSRVCDGDPAVVVERSQEFIDAMATAKIQPVIKHFPGIGQTTKDLHFQFDQVTVTQAEAQVYQALFETYPGIGVMVSHVGVTNQFPDVPCSLSSTCVGQISNYYADSLIVSDALEMASAGYQPESEELLPLPQVAEKAVRAGNQLLVFGPQVTLNELNQVIAHLESIYNADPTFQVAVDQAIRRLNQVPNL